jgi:hypothetical protein
MQNVIKSHVLDGAEWCKDLVVPMWRISNGGIVIDQNVLN